MEFLKDILIAICKDADEVPTREGVEWLMGIAKKSAADTLQLRRARLGPTSTLQLAKRLEGVSLPTIDLFENAVKDVGFMALAKFSERHFALKRLNCGCCGLTDDAALALADAVRYNCGLEAVELGFPTGYIFASCERASRDSAYVNEITGQGVAYLTRSLHQNTHLKYLGLAGSQIGEGEAASAVGKLLAYNQTLTSLDLSFCGLHDAGAAAVLGGLAANSTLQHLRVSGNEMTFLAIPHLAAALATPTCPLAEVFLDENPIGMQGARALARGVVSSRSLRRLSVAECALTDEGAALLCAAVAKAGQGLAEFDAERYADDSAFLALNDEIVDSFIKNIALSANEQYDKDCAPDEKRIIILNHKGRVLSATRLRRVTTAEQTACRDRPKSVAQGSLRQESASNRLHLEDIVECDNLDEMCAAPPAYSKTQRLENGLYIRCEYDDPASSAALQHDEAKSEDENEEMNDSGDQGEENRYFATNLLQTRFDAQEQSRIDDFASGSDFLTTASQSTRVSSVTHLNIAGNGVAARTVCCVCELLRGGSQLRGLDLQGNRLGDSGACALADALLNAGCLGCRAGRRAAALTHAAAPATLAPAPAANQSLTHLSVRRCGISDSGFAALCTALAELPNAIAFDARDNYIGEHGGREGIRRLQGSAVLLTCKLQGNQIGHTDKLALQRHLDANRARITMNAPKRLQSKIVELTAQVRRLPLAREEMDFLACGVRKVTALVQAVRQQQAELEEQHSRQISNLRARQEQQEGQIGAIISQIAGCADKSRGLAAHSSTQAGVNADSLLQAQSALKLAAQRHEQLLGQKEARKLSKSRSKADSRSAADAAAEQNDALRALKTRAEALTEQLSVRFGAQCARALASQVPLKLSIQCDLEQLRPCAQRVERLLGGARQLPPIRAYDCSYLDFAAPRRARSAKGAKGAKSVKGVKGVKSAKRVRN